MAAPGYAGPDTELRPDAEHIRAFISWWFERCTRGKIEIGWLDGRGHGLVHFAQFEKEDLDELVATAFQANIVPGQSCYVRASTVNGRAASGTEFTTDADFVQAPGIWNDIDTQEQMERAKAVQSMVRPNASVITGTQPHMRVQNWFKASEPIVSPDVVRSLNKRIHKLYGGDPAVVNPSRLMRLPGTIAWPWKKDRTTPELTTFIRPAATDPRPLSYSSSMLSTQLPADEQAQARPAEPLAGMRATFNTAAELIRLIRIGSNWHDNMIKLVAHWVGRGWSNAEVLTAAEAFTLPGFTQSQTLAEVTKAIEGARKKWGISDQDQAVDATFNNPFPSSVIDPWDVLQPPEFPIHALPGVLRAYVEDRARIMGADPCAIAWAALSACSAALNGRTRLRLKRHDTWSVPPTLWVALIGRSSAKKTPIINDAWRPLEALQSVALRAYAMQLARWNALPKDEKKQTPPPSRPIRLLTHDATMEGLQDILSHQDRGIGVLRDELAGLIGAMDKYSGNGNGGAADRAFWLQSYNGGPHVIDRVGRGTVSIDNLLTAICGGIQPDRLVQFANLADDGFWQRFAPIIMRPGAMGLDEPSGEAVNAYSARLQGLVDVAVAPGAALSDAAHEIRAQLEQDIFTLEQDEPLGSRFATFTGKLPGLFGRLALVLSYLEPSGLGFIVGKQSAQMAHTLIMHCIIPHAARVYMTMDAQGPSGDGMQGIAGYLLTKKLTRIVMSDLTSNVRQCRKLPVHDVLRMVSPLVSGGWLVPENETPNNRAWLVNPSVHVKFEVRAARETARRAAARALVAQEENE